VVACLTKSTQLFKGKAWSQTQPSQFLAQCHCYLVMLPSFLYCCQCSASCSGESRVKGHLRKSACLSLAPSSCWCFCLSFLEPCECMGASSLHAACCEFLFPQQVHTVASAIVCGPVANLSQADCWVSLPSCVS
jgi:hypothetical protein